jgi:hypothetical protein
MWADSLLSAEQRYLIRVIIWGCGSLSAGLLIIGILAARRHRSPLLVHFAIQLVTWGGAATMLSVVRLRSLELRDVAGATRLDRLLWFSSGLELGIAGIGLAIGIASWRGGRRLGGVGAGLAIMAQGLALMVLDLQLLASIAR